MLVQNQTTVANDARAEYFSQRERLFAETTNRVPFLKPAIRKFTFIDLFAGIGGFRLPMQELGGDCVFTSEIDPFCQAVYEANYGDIPYGDITKIHENEVPSHDILCAGFPCQPFSIIGQGKGFNDTRGTLFFDIVRILKAKKPGAFILENVKQLKGHNNGQTLQVILDTLQYDLGYQVQFKVLNALHFGLPQKRERIFIVGARTLHGFEWPQPQQSYTPLETILESEVEEKHYASEFIRKRRQSTHVSKHALSIWHENKAGNISSYPFSCALRAGASYNYLLVNGERRLTPREMLRLQGFPDAFRIVVNDGQVRKQAGNAVPVNLVRAVAGQLIDHLKLS